MKKRKMIYSAILAFLVLFVLFIYNELNGNPLSKFYATKTLEKYLAETYPEREFRVDEGYYNFKFSEYGFNVVEIGSESSKESGPRTYEFTVRGHIKPFVNIDSIYSENLDEPLMQKLSNEAQEEIKGRLSKTVSSVKEVGVSLEVQKGKYDPETVWNKNMELEKPMGMHIVLDATNLSKEDVLEDAKKVQTILNENGYKYDVVNINANVIGKSNGDTKDDLGYVKFALAFNKDSQIKLSDIEEL